MKVLMVPVRLDALLLDRDRNVTEASADFSKMPFFNGVRDINSESPNLSEALLSKVFQNNNLFLRAGVHLHWSLPDALTHGSHNNSQEMVFPVVPNRWLVSRFQETGTNRTLEKQWIVESDYLYPKGEGANSGSVSFPQESNDGVKQPFRYLGRVIPLGSGISTDRDEYLPKLTAMGYGDPMFSAFYPNCHSVFGFHDDLLDHTTVNLPDKLAVELPDKLKDTFYEVIGWYSDGGADHLKKFSSDLTEEGLSSSVEIVEAIKQRLEWQTVDLVTQNPPTAPEEMLCYARIRFNPDGEMSMQPPDDDVQIAVGNTAAEALAAYIGHSLESELKQDGAEQNKIEDQLEALRLSAHLRDKELDLAAKLREARHDRGFSPSGDGILWSIQQENELKPGEEASPSSESLPESMALSLNHLNDLQQQYIRAQREITALREQTFTDWYKFMAASYPPGGSDEQYPDIDQIRFFIETRDLKPLTQKIEAAGELELETVPLSSRVISARSTQMDTFNLAYRLAREINTLLANLSAVNQDLSTQGKSLRFTLLRVAAPRFWRPNDPAIMLKGEAVKPGKRHGRDGLLRCDLLELEQHISMQALASTVDFGLISLAIDKIEIAVQNTGMSEDHGFSLWRNQPWNPLALQWRAEVRPVMYKANLPLNQDINTDQYDPDFIRDNYRLNENRPELKLQLNKGGLTRAAGIISGYCILTPGAAEQAQDTLENYLIENTRAVNEAELRSELLAIISETKSNFENKNKNENKRLFDDPIYTALMAYQELLKGHHVSQALDGFHEALLMRKKTMQLEPSDPLAFLEYRDFTDLHIRNALKESLSEAPAALNDFMPLRSGGLKLTGLRVLDSFGRYLDLDWQQESLTKAISLTDLEQPDLVALPPRLCQPARLNFRFLASRENTGEMNSLPNTNPVCGWIMPNNLDDSLMIYDNAGVMLGYINKAQEWRSAPGDDTPEEVEDFQNVYLRRVVQLLLGVNRTSTAEFHEVFISALNRALENIDPENYAQHQSMALLVGRPMAVVRAALNIELEGPPALHQGWMALRNDMGRHIRETNNFENIKFPIRLGEFKQFNDGLVGYWKESSKGIEANAVFYAPQSDITETQDLISSRGEGNNLAQSIADAPQIVTMLMDPRGSLHATSGILPVKEIQLPPAQYTAALENIEAVFLRAPVITPAARFSIPLSQQTDHVWSWLSRQGTGWMEISAQGIIKKEQLLESFPAGEMLWEELLASNWINANEEDQTKADVVPTDQRLKESLGEFFGSLTNEIEALLDAAYIHQPGSSADFPGSIEICEGWLRLAAKK